VQDPGDLVVRPRWAWGILVGPGAMTGGAILIVRYIKRNQILPITGAEMEHRRCPEWLLWLARVLFVITPALAITAIVGVCHRKVAIGPSPGPTAPIQPSTLAPQVLVLLGLASAAAGSVPLK